MFELIKYYKEGIDLLRLTLKPDALYLSSTDTQAIDKLRGAFMIEALEETIFASIRANNIKNTADLDNITLLPGQKLYGDFHTIKLTSGACMVYFDPQRRID